MVLDFISQLRCVWTQGIALSFGLNECNTEILHHMLAHVMCQQGLPATKCSQTNPGDSASCHINFHFIYF